MSAPVMDDKRALALMAAVTSNMDRLRQGIDALRQLHDCFRDDSGASINLIAQLSALKSNLGEMHDWMHYAISDIHPQLLSDLDVLMVSCGLLADNLEALTSQMRQPDHVHTDFATKLKFAVGTRSMARLRSVAKRQTDAVNLLLAACKWYVSDTFKPWSPFDIEVVTPRLKERFFCIRVDKFGGKMPPPFIRSSGPHA